MENNKPKSLSVALGIQRKNRSKSTPMAKAETPKPMAPMERHDSIAEAIRSKLKGAQMMAEGGMVEADDEDMDDSEDLGSEDLEADMKEPAEEEIPAKDLASRIRAKMKSKQGE